MSEEGNVREERIMCNVVIVKDISIFCMYSYYSISSSVMEHTQTWLEQHWGITKDSFSSLKSATRLREDLHFDEVALEDLFYYLSQKYEKNVSDDEVFGRVQTLESVAKLFSQEVIFLFIFYYCFILLF